MKILVLAILAVVEIRKLLLLFVDIRSGKNPIPENVRDVYDEPTYLKWKAYTREKNRLKLISELVSFCFSFLLLCFNVYALVAEALPSGVYLSALFLTIFDALVSTLIDVPVEWYDTMKIEEKYGFNKSTKKTFVGDQVKGFIITLLLSCGLVSLYALLHTKMGDWMILLFFCALFLFVLGVGFLSPVLLKIFNKFTPLEEGELRSKLSALMESHGYSVRDIKVMDASRRSTKSNAMFTGFGKSKTIILYDTLVNSMTTDEICAVFAHEMGHGLHKDTLKNQAINSVQMLAIAALAWLVVRYPEIYTAFGFEGVNYGFAIILMGIALSLVTPLFGLFMSFLSRKAEYRADAQAVEDGYGADLVSALKKLSRENFANLAPSRITVLLEYSHPTTSDRIKAIEEKTK